MRRLPVLLSLLALATASCDQATSPRGVTAPPPGATKPPPTSNATQAVSLRLVPSGTQSIPGGRLVVDIYGADANSRPVSTGGATVTMSDSKVARITDVKVEPVANAQTDVSWTFLRVLIALSAEGTSTLRVSLDSLVATLDLHVRQPQPSTALVVDSFTVLEARVECAWDCPYLAYWPVLKLREPTGNRTVTVDAVEFTIPGLSTGLCEGAAIYGPGASAFAVTFDPYIWNNDVLLVRLDGTPVPEGEAAARVIVHDDAGNPGVIETTGKIQRMVKNPILPSPEPPGPNSWGCQ